MKDKSHDVAMAEVFRNDPSYAAALLNNILEEGDQAELLIALRQLQTETDLPARCASKT